MTPSLFQDAFKATQIGYTEELSQVKQNHEKELEAAASKHVDANEKLQKSHDEALAQLKLELATLKSDLEDEKEAKVRAITELSELKTRSPPATPSKPMVNGDGMSKEQVAKIHQAHEAKLAEMESDFHKQLEALREEKETSTKELQDLKGMLDRERMEKAMYEEQAADAEAEIERCVVHSIRRG